MFATFAAAKVFAATRKTFCSDSLFLLFSFSDEKGALWEALASSKTP